MNIWKSKSERIQLDLNSVIGFKYWPANHQSIGFSWGGLDVLTLGGKTEVGLQDGGEELFSVLKTQFASPREQ